MVISDLGIIEFTKAYAIQERLSAEVAEGAADEALLLLGNWWGIRSLILPGAAGTCTATYDFWRNF